MSIRELRILPPLAFGRLGSAPEPLDNFTILDNDDHPLGYRRIVPQETLTVDPRTGEISGSHTPKDMAFKDGERIRPVAPFLEVFARVDRSRKWQPLTAGLLARHGCRVKDLSWQVTVANRKVESRTADPNDAVEAATGWFSTHAPQPLQGHCANFISRKRFIDFGSVRFIKPTRRYPEIRFRFSPSSRRETGRSIATGRHVVTQRNESANTPYGTQQWIRSHSTSSSFRPTGRTGQALLGRPRFTE